MAGRRRPQGHAGEGRGTAPTRGRGRKAAATAAAYARHLDGLAARKETAWGQEATALINTKRPRDYDLAVSLLQDLQALANRQGDTAAFTKQFLELRARHQRKPSLLDRFDKANRSR
jgi:uncharacterized Zn finger protein